MASALRTLGLVCLLASSGMASAQDQPPVKVGVIGAFSGPSAAIGVSMREAVRLATTELNWKGGLNGRKIELVERDDGDDPEKAERLVKDMIKNDKIEFAVGFTNNAVALRALQPLQDAKIPVMVNVATDNALTELFLPPMQKDNYVFRNVATDVAQANVIAREVLERGRYSKVAILAESSPYGRNGSETIKRQIYKRLQAAPWNAEADSSTGWLRGGNGKFMPQPMIAMFQPGQTNMSEMVSQAKAYGAEALIVWGQAPEAVAIAKARNKLGWSVPLIGSSDLGTDAFIKLAGAHGAGARMPADFVADPINSRRQEFLIAYRHQTNAELIAAPTAAAQGYDSMLLLAAAVRQANSTQGPAVREALENLQGNVFGVICTYEKPFKKDDHEAITPDMIVTGEITNGRVGFAYKDEARAVILGKRTTREVANSR